MSLHYQKDNFTYHLNTQSGDDVCGDCRGCSDALLPSIGEDIVVVVVVKGTPLLAEVIPFVPSKTSCGDATLASQS